MFLKLIIAFVACACAFAADPLPKPWPSAFTVKFDSNITMTDSVATANPIHNIMYYDYDIKSQRVDHGAGSYECYKFYYSNEPCTIWFTNEGLFRKLESPLPDGQPECCLDMPEIKASAPGWATSTDPLPTYAGLETELYSGIKSDHWIFNTGDPNPCRAPHEYQEEHSTGKPVLFTFPVLEGQQDYHFLTESLTLGKPKSTLFDLPKSCRLTDGTPNMCPQPQPEKSK